MEFAASDHQPASPGVTETEPGRSAVDTGSRSAPEPEASALSDTPKSAVAAAFDAPSGTAWTRVAPHLAWYRRLTALIIVVPAIVLGGAAAWLWWGWQWAGVLAGVALFVTAVSWLAARFESRSWGYAEGRTDFYLTYGVFVRQLIVVPYGRMQVVDVTSNLLEQALGIATVRVRTAATTADTRIPGLRFDDAVRLRDQLAARSETFSTGL